MASWSKEVFSKNLQYFMRLKGISQKELAEVIGVSAPTLNEWIKGKKYPRIDKIEKLANYFKCLKSDLIEEKTPEEREVQKNNDILADIIVRLRTDEEFSDIVKILSNLDAEKLAGIKGMLITFLK
jgi:transcriptional regulator with XRE-family HTH domain